MVAAMTLIALVDNFDAREERLTELERDGNAAIGLCSLSGVLWELYKNTHNTQLIKLKKRSQINGRVQTVSKIGHIIEFTCIFWLVHSIFFLNFPLNYWAYGKLCIEHTMWVTLLSMASVQNVLCSAL
jgi:hypothetical protein